MIASLEPPGQAAEEQMSDRPPRVAHLGWHCDVQLVVGHECDGTEIVMHGERCADLPPSGGTLLHPRPQIPAPDGRRTRTDRDSQVVHLTRGWCNAEEPVETCMTGGGVGSEGHGVPCENDLAVGGHGASLEIAVHSR